MGQLYVCVLDEYHSNIKMGRFGGSMEDFCTVQNVESF